MMRKTLRSFFNIVISAVIAAVPLAVFTFAPQIAHAGTNQCSWSGAGSDNNWSTAANWTCSVGTVPTTGYDLIFPYVSVNEPTTNDLSASNVYSGLWFTGTIPNNCTYGVIYDIDGNGIQLAGNIEVQTTNGCTKYIVINAPVTITSAATFDISSTAVNETNLEMHNLNLGSNNLTIASETVTPSVYKASISLSGVITGSGNITSVGDVYMYGTSPAYSGNVSITNGLLFTGQGSLGTTSGSTTIGNNATLGFGTCGSNISIAENITFVGTGVTYGLGGPSGKLYSSPQCGGGMPPTETYGAYYSSQTITLTGTLTLTNSVTVGAFHNFIVNGPIAGPGNTLTLAYDATPGTYFYGGQLQISASSNNSTTANGTYRNPVRLTSLTDSQPSNTVGIGTLSTVTINGTRSDVTVSGGGILKGTGTIGNLDASFGGIVAPGTSPGTLNTGNVTYDATTTHQEELGGTGAGNFDQLNVTGTVNLGGATLATSLYGGYVPALNDSYVIINNDSTDAITGTFAGLAQNAEFTLAGGYKFRISYTGGTGNDVTLTSTYVPGPPGTGLGSLTSSVYLPVAAILTGAGIMLVARKKYYVKAFTRR